MSKDFKEYEVAVPVFFVCVLKLSCQKIKVVEINALNKIPA